MQQAVLETEASPARQIEKETQRDLGKKVISLRKHSHTAARKQMAMGIYKAPVVKNRYRKIVNHFHNKPKSFANEGKNNTPEMTTTLNSSINLKKV